MLECADIHSLYLFSFVNLFVVCMIFVRWVPEASPGAWLLARFAVPGPALPAGAVHEPRLPG